MAETVTPGSETFERAVFELSGRYLSPDILRALNFNNGMFQNTSFKDIYAMPAYLSSKLKMFFVLSKYIRDGWFISLSKAQVKDGRKVTSMSDAMPTGRGLNQIAIYSPYTANRILSYFNTLSVVDRGKWRLINN